MKLLTSLPARKDGTLIVRHDGAMYVFEGQPLACEVENEAHAEHLQAHGFLTEEDFEAEQKFLRIAAERNARRVALAGGVPSSRGTFTPALGQDADDDDANLDSGTGLPQEADSTPTGRVRKASRASTVTG